MNQYVGLDVSLEETKIYVLDEAGGRVWRGKCASHPDELETAICKHAPGGHCHIVERRTREFCVPNIFKLPRLPRATCS